MRVEMWADVVCPWAYIGKRRLERAPASWDGEPHLSLAAAMSPEYDTTPE
ncbi:DsbA family protein [Sphaerimonospora thailandensis]|uniref:DSBA-like thioredoxin domain-containing protein n=1 Tax=Sphaerimonospora thailandensis TaxID=795644 RepID=A0A8J3W141_9ACTN|nr:hypothetical protein Mth01_45550 [Sphaerimonospora thailandensis]